VTMPNPNTSSVSVVSKHTVASELGVRLARNIQRHLQVQ